MQAGKRQRLAYSKVQLEKCFAELLARSGASRPNGPPTVYCGWSVIPISTKAASCFSQAAEADSIGIARYVSTERIAPSLLNPDVRIGGPILRLNGWQRSRTLLRIIWPVISGARCTVITRPTPGARIATCQEKP